jgi:hypothetical protein
MTKDILAFISTATGDTQLELPRASILFGLLSGLDGAAEPLYAPRGRFADLSELAHDEFDRTMAQGESHLTRAELLLVLERHRTLAPAEAEANALLAAYTEQHRAFTLTFGFY